MNKVHVIFLQAATVIVDGAIQERFSGDEDFLDSKTARGYEASALVRRIEGAPPIVVLAEEDYDVLDHCS